MPTDYRARLKMPQEWIDQGDPEVELFTKAGNRIARGFTRIVIGGRGPYVEFQPGQLDMEQLQAVRIGAYYVEYRSKDDAMVKIYLQLARVDYADYKIGLAYISPFDLRYEDGSTLIDPLPKGKKGSGAGG